MMSMMIVSGLLARDCWIECTLLLFFFVHLFVRLGMLAYYLDVICLYLFFASLFALRIVVYDMFGMTPAPAHATKEELNSSLDCVTAAKGEKYGNTDSSYVVAGATAFDNEAVMAPAFVLKQQQVLLQLSVNCPVLSINIRTSIRNWISHASIANIFSGAEVSDADASVAEGSLGAPQWVVDCDACIVGEVSSAVVTESSTISLELPVYQHFPLKDLGTTSARQLKVYSTVDIVLSSLHKLTVSRYLHDQSRNATTMEVQTKPVQTQVLFFPLSLDQGGKLSRQGNGPLHCVWLLFMALHQSC